MNQSITLNLPFDLSEVESVKIMAVYREMDAWIENEELPCWFGKLNDTKFIVASLEPSGLLLEGNLDPLLFRGWITKLCAKLTLALGREIYDAEA